MDREPRVSLCCAARAVSAALPESPALRKLSLCAAVVTLALVAGQAIAGHDVQSRSTPGIVFERSGDLYAIALDGSWTVRLTNTPVWDEVYPAVSPDGRWIAYSRRHGFGERATLWVMSIDGRKRKRITRGDDFDPALSPDGYRIYFSRFLTEGTEPCGSIFKVGADGWGVKRVTRAGRHSHQHPAVSPDGARVAFTDANQCSGGTTSWALRVTDNHGRKTSELAHLPGNAYYPVNPDYAAPKLVPDGNRIAFNSDGTISLANRDGTGLRRVTPRADFIESPGPAWSPDREWIAFTNGQGDLYAIHPDGTGLRRLTRSKARETSPSWLRRMPAG